jgi:hypothetical protein
LPKKQHSKKNKRRVSKLKIVAVFANANPDGNESL